MSHLKPRNQKNWEKKSFGAVIVRRRFRCCCSLQAFSFLLFFTFSFKGLTGRVGVTDERAEGDISLPQKLNAAAFSALCKALASQPSAPPPNLFFPSSKNKPNKLGVCMRRSVLCLAVFQCLSAASAFSTTFQRGGFTQGSFLQPSSPLIVCF